MYGGFVGKVSRVHFFKSLAAVTVLSMLVAPPMEAAQFEAWARAEGFYSGVSSARPEQDPTGFVILGSPDLQSVSAVADNFFLNNGTDSAALSLRWTNPVDDRVFVSLVFRYDLELYFGSDGLWEDPQPGMYDVTMQAGLEATRGDASPQSLGALTLDQTLNCPSPACADRYRSSSTSSPGLAYLDFTMDPMEIVDITLRSFVSVSASPVSSTTAPVPLPTSVPLMLTGLAALAGLRRRARRAA